MTPSPRDPDSPPIPPAPEQEDARVLREEMAADQRRLADFQESLTRALNAAGVPAMPSWQEAIDYLAMPRAEVVAQTRAELLAEIDAAILREASAAQSDGRVDKAALLTALAIDLAREFGGPFGGDGRPG